MLDASKHFLKHVNMKNVRFFILQKFTWLIVDHLRHLCNFILFIFLQCSFY